MHELSIALSILEMAAEEAERHGAVRILSIRLRLGPLAGVVKEALVSAFELARDAESLESERKGDRPLLPERPEGCFAQKGSVPFSLRLLGDARLVIEDVPITGRCPKCGSDQPVVAIDQLECATCGTPTADIVSGRELEVVALEIE